MKNAEIIHKGCDGITVAFQGMAPQNTLDQMEIAKTVAAELGGESLMTIGGTTFNMMEKGSGAKQGYTYQLHTGRHGIKYQIKKSLDPSQWNLRARVSAMYLAMNGVAKAQEQMRLDFAALNVTVIDESVSNIDVCVDVKMDAKGTRRDKCFQLNEKLFLHHSKATKRQYYSENEGDDNDLSVFGGRYIESVTIGSKSGRQLCVYNKRAEQRSKRRSEWFEFWGEDKETCVNIWRVEYRFGKTFLKDWNIKTIDELIACYGKLLEDSLLRIRYALPTKDSNQSRWPNHPFWDLVVSAFADMVITCEIDGLTRGRIRRATRDDFKQIYVSQINGLTASLCETLNIETALDAQKLLPSIIEQQIKKYLMYDYDKFKLSKKKAKARMYYLKEHPEREPENA